MRTGKFSYLFFVSLLLIIVVSCSIQKRSYRQGYHIEWKNKNHSDLPLKKYSSEKYNAESSSLAMRYSLQEILTQSPTLPSENKNTGAALSKKTVMVDNCDTILFTNGRKVIAKILEINPTEIKYKSCNNPDPTVNTVDKNEIRTVIYSNGTKEYFGEVNKEPSPNKELSNRNFDRNFDDYHIRDLADDSLTAGIIGLVGLILFPLGAIGSIIAIRKGKRALEYMGKDPVLNGKYGKKARTGVTTGRIGCLITLLILVLYIVLIVVLKI